MPPMHSHTRAPQTDGPARAPRRTISGLMPPFSDLPTVLAVAVAEFREHTVLPASRRTGAGAGLAAHGPCTPDQVRDGPERLGRANFSGWMHCGTPPAGTSNPRRPGLWRTPAPAIGIERQESHLRPRPTRWPGLPCPNEKAPAYVGLSSDGARRARTGGPWVRSASIAFGRCFYRPGGVPLEQARWRLPVCRRAAALRR